MIINKLVVVGVGLIGSSLAAALKARGGCVETIGVVRRPETGREALRLGVVDRVCTGISEVASELRAGDVIFIAVPTLAITQVLEQVRECVAETGSLIALDLVEVNPSLDEHGASDTVRAGCSIVRCALGDTLL
ncbi:MAG: prephenate dehydrogenase/arogenate dehydrogenase family protein [Exilibacterium sp.]